MAIKTLFLVSASSITETAQIIVNNAQNWDYCWISVPFPWQNDVFSKLLSALQFIVSL